MTRGRRRGLGHAIASDCGGVWAAHPSRAYTALQPEARPPHVPRRAVHLHVKAAYTFEPGCGTGAGVLVVAVCT
eukprot:6934533-Prymnesium_polylepis.1